jgi:hypothetical protein
MWYILSKKKVIANEGFGRKQTCPELKYYPRIFLGKKQLFLSNYSAHSVPLRSSKFLGQEIPQFYGNLKFIIVSTRSCQ